MPAVSAQELEALLDTAATYVSQTYTDFRTALGTDKFMAEVGLTDLYMMKAMTYAKTKQHAIKFWKSHNENSWGADFEAAYLDGITNTSHSQIYFQAKVLHGNGADFLYESTNNRKSNFQVILLDKHVKDENAKGYYVIYDSTGVHYVNVTKVMDAIKKTNVTASIAEWNKQLYTALAKSTLAAADAVVV